MSHAVPDTLDTVSDPRTTTATQDRETATDQTSSDIARSLETQESPAAAPYDPASYYWDAATMAPLNAVSAAAIARLRAYKPPPFPTWDRLPASRRAAVLILLFADRRGDLRVVITMRAASLRSFSGHAAFPGGKADSASESAYQIARREAWEEIGLPMDDSRIPKPFRIEPLCNLPCSLAKTELAVRPCVAFLHVDKPSSTLPTSSASSAAAAAGVASGDDNADTITVDESMIPRLDAKEVAAVFSASLRGFLRIADEPRRLDQGEPPLPEGEWYDGYWTNWGKKPWRVHNFHVPVDNQRVTKPRPPPTLAKQQQGGNEEGGGGEEATPPAALLLAEKLDEVPDSRFLVWGMTGRMLVDTARVAYGEEPEFEHNDHYGDEELIESFEDSGRMYDKKRNNEVGQDAIKEEVKETKI